MSKDQSNNLDWRTQSHANLDWKPRYKNGHNELNSELGYLGAPSLKAKIWICPNEWVLFLNEDLVVFTGSK